MLPWCCIFYGVKKSKNRECLMKYLLILFTLITASCATTIPNRFEKHTEIDSKEIGILITPFEINPSVVKDVDNSMALGLGEEIATDIRSALFRNGYENVTIGNEPSNHHILIKGKITEVTGGNKHQRVWLGFGYGGTVVSARGEIYDVKKESSIMNFSVTKQSNWTYSGNETAVRENIYETAEEIVKELLAK